MHQEQVVVNCPHCSFVIEVVAPDLDRPVESALPSKTWWSGERSSQLGCPSCNRAFYVAWTYRSQNKHFKILNLPPARQATPQLSHQEVLRLLDQRESQREQ